MSEHEISHSVPISMQAVRLIQKEAERQLAIQVESEEDLNQYFELAVFNPLQRANQFKELSQLRSQTSKSEKTSKEGDKIKSLEALAEQFQQNNYELNAKTLLILHSRMQDAETLEEILERLLLMYPDPALADEALDFLLQSSSGRQNALFRAAKERLNTTYEREIKSGRNMGAESRAFSIQGLGSATSLRDLYRNITGTPRDTLQLFQELTEHFAYAKMKKIIEFLLHSLGADLKTKGSSIPHPELKRLIDDTRSLQGILGVFRFFQSRMKLIQNLFVSAALLLPQRLDYELLSKVFIKLLAERYISPDKIAKTAQLLGIEEEVLAQLIIYAQMRDAVRQVAPRYYRNQQHKEDLLNSFILYLEKLEEEEENEEEESTEDEQP